MNWDKREALGIKHKRSVERLIVFLFKHCVLSFEILYFYSE